LVWLTASKRKVKSTMEGGEEISNLLKEETKERMAYGKIWQKKVSGINALENRGEGGGKLPREEHYSWKVPSWRKANSWTKRMQQGGGKGCWGEISKKREDL